MTRVAVAPNKYARGFQPGQEDVRAVYVVRELRAALAEVYKTDAHLVAYLVDGLERQPRVNKPGLEHFGRRLTVECLLCDVDNPGHGEWTNQAFQAAREQDRTLPTLASAGIYYTRHGRRVVQPIATPLPVEHVEAHLAAWLRRLEADGLTVDWACRDWTRHYRLPNVPREPGGRSRCVDLALMRPLELPPIAPDPEEPPRDGRRRSGSRGSAVSSWTTTLPEAWRPIAEKLAPAVQSVSTEWHSAFMALAGALLSRGVPPEHVPALCGAVSVLTSADDRLQDRLASARTTVERWQSGLPMTGYATLVRQWPAVADALDDAFAGAHERRLREQSKASSAPAPTLTLEETTRALELAIERAPPGLTLIKAECGLGKTQAALRVAARRAAKPHANARAEGTRAPAGSKTSLSVDKHKLALQCMVGMHRLGQQAARLFGPVSLEEPSGDPVCQLHPVARPLVAGGLRMQWELCERRGSEEKCPHYEGCRARLGREGPDEARFVVGPHALIGELDASAGTTGLLVIDEIQEFLETTELTAAELALARDEAYRWFDGVFVGALMPGLHALERFLAAAGPGVAIDACDAVRRHQSAVPQDVLEQARRSSGVPGDAVACAAAAPFPKRHHGTSPPVLRVAMDQVTSGLLSPDHLGAMARVLKTVHHALASEYPVSVRVERRGDSRALLVTAPREALARALRREGAVVVLDANVDLHAPVLTRIVGYEPPLHTFTAGDGAPIERTLIRTRNATRKQWFKDGKLQAAPGLALAVKAVVDWARERPDARTLGIITFAAVEVALRFAAGLDPPDACRTAWAGMGQPAAALDALSRRLGPALVPWRGTLLTGHYGATRGLDDFAGCDALATLGDPWMNLGDARNDATFLGLGDNWEARYEARCRAELEQAHGRLRTVHRTKPGRALHVGAVLPGGTGWEGGGVIICSLQGGRPPGSPGMTAEAFTEALVRIGGVRATARLLGCDPKLVQRYRDGRSPVPDRVAHLISPRSAPISADPTGSPAVDKTPSR